MIDNPVLRIIAKIIIPMILLFALYVQFHGDFGPGGGFQAGVIFAAGFILYGLVFGPKHCAAPCRPERYACSQPSACCSSLGWVR